MNVKDFEKEEGEECNAKLLVSVIVSLRTAFSS